MSNRKTVAHEVMQFEAIDRLERVGLGSNSLLKVIQAFAPLFVDLFIYSGTLEHSEAIYVDESETETPSDEDEQLVVWVCQ